MLVLTLPAFALALRGALRGAFGRGALVALGLAYALCALPIPYSRFTWDAGASVLLFTPRLYGMIVLLSVMLTQQQCRRG